MGLSWFVLLVDFAIAILVSGKMCASFFFEVSPPDVNQHPALPRSWLYKTYGRKPSNRASEDDDPFRESQLQLQRITYTPLTHRGSALGSLKEARERGAAEITPYCKDGDYNCQG